MFRHRAQEKVPSLFKVFNRYGSESYDQLSKDCCQIGPRVSKSTCGNLDPTHYKGWLNDHAKRKSDYLQIVMFRMAVVRQKSNKQKHLRAAKY